jgi:hypothetical protein
LGANVCLNPYKKHQHALEMWVNTENVTIVQYIHMMVRQNLHYAYSIPWAMSMFVTGNAIPIPGTREQAHPQSEKKTFLRSVLCSSIPVPQPNLPRNSVTTPREPISSY